MTITTDGLRATNEFREQVGASWPFLDVQAMLGTAEATLRGAIAREETRGAYNRSDFPELGPAMEVNFIVGRNSEARMTLEPIPVPAVPVELAPWLARAGNIDPAGKLLE